ncbi:MAG: hypothetical protein AAF789_08630 [Bacteroidota bacterium]
MKKLLTLKIMLLTYLAGFHSQAQEVGTGLVYAAEFNQLGIGVNGTFELNEEFEIAPSFFYYLTAENNFEINGNVNYHLSQEGIASVYGIGGLNFTTFQTIEDNEETRSTEIGLNIGIGSTFDLNSDIIPFAEAKYVLGNADQLSLFLGVRISLSNLKQQ